MDGSQTNIWGKRRITPPVTLLIDSAWSTPRDDTAADSRLPIQPERAKLGAVRSSGTPMNPVQFLRSLIGRSGQMSLATADALLAQGKHAEAVAQYRLLATQGDVAARHALAQCLESGAGTLQNPGLAVRAYTQAAESGHLPSIARLGELYLSGLARPDTASASVVAQLADPKAGSSVFQQLFPDGLSVEPDAVLAARWNVAGALAGDPGSQSRLGHQYAAGLGVPQNLLLARKWFRRGANGGHPLGALGMGLLTLDHYGRAPRHYDPIPWLEVAVAQGDVSAQLALALYVLDNPTVAPPERAGQLLLAAAKAGHPFAMLKLGDCYAAGSNGLAQDERTAEVWLRRASAKGLTGANVRLLRLLASQPDRNDQELAVLAREAAEAGHAEAQYLLGVFTLTGQGTLEDPSEAAKWFELAAAQGVTGAHERLGAMYATGVGKDADPALAVEAFERAVALGDLDALTHRAILRQSGIGLPRDPTRAAEEFLQASDSGHPEAALQLGIAYAAGLGVPQDWVRAAHYYRLAHERGVPEGSFNLGHLVEQGLGVTPSAAEAIALFASAGERGLVAALWALYQRSAPNEDGTLSAEQRQWLTQAARLGDNDAADLLQPPAPSDASSSGATNPS